MRCPFFEEIVMAYCSACQKKKMIAKDQLMQQNPCEADYNTCPIYKTFLTNQEKEMSKNKVPSIQEKSAEQAAPAPKATEKEKPCIWMKAGVIAYRMCTKNYDCKTCEFDQALLDQSGSYKEAPLVVQAIEKMRQLPASEKKCRYMLTGDFAFKICSNNYECWHCAVDQYVQDMIDADPYLRRRREREAKKEKIVKGFKFRDDFFYLPNHIWIKIEGDAVKIGIDDFAAKLIGKIEKVEFTEKQAIPVGDKCWNIGSQNRMVTMSLPITGDIIEANTAVKKNPGLVHSSPYNQGWLLKMKKPAEMTDLFKGAKAQQWLEKELEKLHQEYAGSNGITVTDGGEFVDNLYENLSDEDWGRFIKQFVW
jgi:glycine cleavage system H lipoate-binding protein